MTDSITSETQRQLTRVARGGALNLVGAATTALSGFVLVAVVARTFDPDAAGALFATSSVFLLAVGLVMFGSDTGVIHFLPRFEETGRSADIPTVLRAARLPAVAAGLGVAVAGIGLAEPIADLIRLDDPRAPALIRTMAVCVPLAALGQLALSETRALGRMRPTVMIDNVARPIAQLVGAAVAGAIGAGLLALTWSWVLPYAVTGAIALVVARVMLGKRRARWDTAHAAEPTAVWGEFHRYAWPRGIARLSQVVIQRADIIVIAAALGAAPAAVYTAATRFVVIGQMVAGAIANVLMPRMSQLLARGDLGTVNGVFKVATAWSMLIAWPFYAVIASCASAYLAVFGDGYVGTDGVPVVVTMSLSMMIAVAAGALDTVLLMSGRSLASLLNGLAAAGVNVALCVILIPPMGIAGAAIAWAAAVIVRNGLAYVVVRRDLGVTPWSAGAALVAAAVACCYATPLTALALTGALDAWTGTLALVVGTVAYAAIVWRGREPLALAVLASALRHGARSAPGGT